MPKNATLSAPAGGGGAGRLTHDGVTLVSRLQHLGVGGAVWTPPVVGHVPISWFELDGSSITLHEYRTCIAETWR